MGLGEMSAWEWMKAGGPIMVPIFLCSIAGFAIIIEKLWYLSIVHNHAIKLKENVFAAVKNDQIKEALILCEANPSPVTEILKAGIIKSGSPRDEIEKSITESSLTEIPKLENGLNILSTIANISPLLGLLGTVMGIAGSFHAIQVRAATLSPVTAGDLAGGIWQASITTIAGLLVAIPTFLVYHFCLNRTNVIILEAEKAAAELVSLMCYVSESEIPKKGRLSVEI